MKRTILTTMALALPLGLCKSPLGQPLPRTLLPPSNRQCRDSRNTPRLRVSRPRSCNTSSAPYENTRGNSSWRQAQNLQAGLPVQGCKLQWETGPGDGHACHERQRDPYKADQAFQSQFVSKSQINLSGPDTLRPFFLFIPHKPRLARRACGVGSDPSKLADAAAKWLAPHEGRQ